MALFLLKPVVWNDRGYAGPAGCKTAKDSFPGMYGWGHEEWNNDDRMAFSEKTEHLSRLPHDTNQGGTRR